MGWRVAGVDDDFGRVADFYFDDQSWSVLHLVVTVGKGRSTRQSVLGIETVDQIDEANKLIRLNLRVEEAFEKAGSSRVLPVNKQYELALCRTFPVKTNPNLRSVRACLQHLAILDGHEIGAVMDMVVRTEQWEIRHLKLGSEIKNKVVTCHIQTSCVDRFSWATSRMLLKNFEPVEIEKSNILLFPGGHELPSHENFLPLNRPPAV